MRFLLVLFIICCSIQAYACGCDHKIGIDEAKLVFTGKVLNIKKRGTHIITFSVQEVEKGKVRKKRIVVYTPCLTDECCGIAFKEGETYKVFAYDNNGMLYTNQCTETHKLSPTE